MTLLYDHPRFLEHQTGKHPECAERLQHVTRLLDTLGLTARCSQVDWQPLGRDKLEQVHTANYLTSLEQLAARGGGWADPDTVVSPASVEVAKFAAGAVCDAATRVLAGEDRHALCLVRPPGHHALSDRAMGFCLLNNVALAAQAALNQGAQRVLIVDWDVHHGNGTQAIFYDSARVGYFSIHRWPFYPGTGAAEETGTGDGRGATCNIPVEFGTSREAYLQQFTAALEEFAARIAPELVLISAGFDSHRSDPVGSLGLEVEDFAELTSIVLAVADRYAKGRVVSVLEGGYNPPVLSECVAVHLGVMLGAEP